MKSYKTGAQTDHDGTGRETICLTEVMDDDHKDNSGPFYCHNYCGLITTMQSYCHHYCGLTTIMWSYSQNYCGLTIIMWYYSSFTVKIIVPLPS